MGPKINLEKHKAIIGILLEILPFAIPRFKYFLIIKKENELNSIISRMVGKYYLNDLTDLYKNNDDYLDNNIDYQNICEAYDYILNVIDNAGEKYSQDKVNEIKKFLDLK